MSENYPLLVLVPLFGMLGNVFAHIIISRVNRGRGQIKCLVLGYILGLICGLFLALGAYSRKNVTTDFIAYLFLDFIAYSALSFGYFHFVNINIASLRIRILQEIIDSPQGLSKEAILRSYNAEQILDNRIERLINSNQLIEKQGSYFIGGNRNFLILFWFFETLKLTFIGRGNRLLNVTDNDAVSFGQLISFFWKLQFCRFLLIGAINTIFGYGAYTFLVILGIDYRVALTIATVLAVLFNYYTNGSFVFRNKGRKVLLKFILSNVAMYIFNQALLITFVNLGIGKLISQALIIPVIIIISFVINKKWVFDRRNCPEVI